VRRILDAAEAVPITELIAVCRDPPDDKFIELAVNGRADLIMSGDADLLSLDEARDIPIVSRRHLCGPGRGSSPGAAYPAALEPNAAVATGFRELVLTAITADTGRGGEDNAPSVVAAARGVTASLPKGAISTPQIRSVGLSKGISP
jgi:hypothetical protein